jgi:hypothetical protein
MDMPSLGGKLHKLRAADKLDFRQGTNGKIKRGYGTDLSAACLRSRHASCTKANCKCGCHKTGN